MILRIDDVIASAKESNPKKKPDLSDLD